MAALTNDGASITAGDDSDTTVTAGNADSGWNIVDNPFTFHGADPTFSMPNAVIDPGWDKNGGDTVVWGLGA